MTDQLKRIPWTIVWEVIVVVFLAGIAWASFETKEHASATYMTKELSNERWENNDKSHDKIEKTMNDILVELRKHK